MMYPVESDPSGPSTGQPPAPASISALSNPARHLRVGGVALALLCLALFFWRLGSAPLFDLDEGLYATCAREMVLTGDWITPRLNSRPLANPAAQTTPFFEKPILIYWLAAGAMRLFGISPWSARLPAALASLLTTLLVVRIGARWFGPRAGLFAGLIYATAPITVVDARQLTTDSLLILWFTAALIAFAEGARAGSDKRRTDRAALLFWVACALAVMTKGAIGLLLPALVIGVTVILDRFALRVTWRKPHPPALRFLLRLAPIQRLIKASATLRPLPGMLLLLGLCVPWHLLIWRAGGVDGLGHTWVQEYLIRQHIGRFKGLDTVHNAPLLSYVPYFLLGFFPWACFAPAVFRAPRNDNPNGSQSPASSSRMPLLPFLSVWFWTIFIFFSLSAAKLPTYIAPAYPAAALLTGRWLDDLLRPTVTARQVRSLRRGAAAACVSGLLLMAVALIGTRFAPRNAPIPADLHRMALHLTGLLSLGCGAAWGCLMPKSTGLRSRYLSVGLLVTTMVLLVALSCTDGYRVAANEILGPYQQVAARARPDAERGVPVIYYAIIPRRPSMNFYAGYSPLEHKEEPLWPFLDRYVPPSTRQVDVVTSLDVYTHQLLPELLARHGIKTDLIARRGDWVLVAIIRE